LPNHLDEEFDIVYTSYGVLCWLQDLGAWARILARYLRSGGTFLLTDGHPISLCIDAAVSEDSPRIIRSYFSARLPVCCPPGEEGDHDYHNVNTTAGKTTYEWDHTLGDIINAVADAGLRVVSVHEYPECMYRLLPNMVKGSDGLFRLPDGKSLYPFLFSLKAVKEEIL